MGNCLSKIDSLDSLVDDFHFKDESGKIMKANAMRSLGVYWQKINEILTPVEERFSPQACNLERDKNEYLGCKKPTGITYIHQIGFGI